jgi:hypothetical protein
MTLDALTFFGVAAGGTDTTVPEAPAAMLGDEGAKISTSGSDDLALASRQIIAI